MPRPLPERYDRNLELARLDGLREAKPEAFHGFFEDWFPRVYRFAARRVSSRRHARRVTRRVLTRALSEIQDGFRPRDVSEWLLALVKAELPPER